MAANPGPPVQESDQIRPLAPFTGYDSLAIRLQQILVLPPWAGGEPKQLPTLSFSSVEQHDSIIEAIRKGVDVDTLCSIILRLDPTVYRLSTEDWLHHACRYGHLGFVKLLIKKLGCNPQCNTDSQGERVCSEVWDHHACKEGDNPLHTACRYGSRKIVSYLIDVEQCSQTIPNFTTGELPLHIACCNKDLELVKLVSNCDVNAKTEFKFHSHRGTFKGLADTPLHVACRYSNLGTVRYLCKVIHCDTSIQNAAGELPLHIACSRSMSDEQTLDIIKLVSDCSVNTQTWEDKVTPLHVACKRGRIDIVEYLSEKCSCDTTVRNSNGELSLHIACTHKSLKMVKLVSNCDVNAKTIDTGNTPLHIACKRGNAEIVKYLVEDKHCDTSVRNTNGELPLHIACTHKSLEIVKLVSNCDVNAKTSDIGNTPLHIAYKYGEKNIITFLVQVKFCDLTIRNNDGLLPAANREEMQMLQEKQLIQHKTRNIKDYQAALRQKGALPIRLLKLLISGPPRVGKSSLKWRLVGKRIEIEFLPSTGVADAPIKVTIKRLGQSIAKAHGLQWSQLSVDERAEAILVPLLIQTVASEQDEQQAVGSEKNETQDEQKQEGFVMYSTTRLESLEASMHPKTAPVREQLLESLHTDQDHDFITSDESADHQSNNLTTTCTASDVGSRCSDLLQSSEIPCQHTEELKFVSTNKKGVEREHATPKELPRLLPQILDVEPTPRVNAIEQTPVVPSIHDTPCPDNIETTAELLEFDSKVSPVPQTLSTSVSEPLSTCPGFKDLGALVSACLQEGDEEKLKELLVDTTTIHIVDTGGQPEFHEILPALVTGPAVNLILFKLNEGLQERFVVEYLSPDGKLSEPYITSYTNEDVIFQTLSTIACFSHHDPESIGASCVNAVDQETVAVLVGTHMDQISQEKETQEKKIQEVDELLRDRIKKTEFYTDDLIKFFNPSSKQMIVPIDNTETCEDKAGITALREMLNKTFLERFEEVYVPPAWLIFDLILRKSGAKTLSIPKCHKIAKLCGIESEEEFEEALWYLHHQVGVLMHFPEVFTLKNVVIVQLQLLFDRITDVIANTFTEERTSPFESELFKNRGQFLPKRVKSESRKKQDPLALDKLVKLLEYLHIVAHVLDHSDQSGKKNTYFMPCVLQTAEVGMVFHNPNSSPDQPAPLLIRFSCGFCPVGIFCALVVYLLSETSSSEVKWELSEEETLYRNMITFKVGKAYDKVTLIARSTYYEIWLQGAPMSLHQMCNAVRNQLHAAIRAVSDTLHYSYRSSHQFGFYCPQTACYKSQMTPHNHIAVCSYDNPSHMKCLVSDKPSPLPPMCAVWYGKEADLGTVYVGESEGAKPIQQYQTTELRRIPVDHKSLKPADLANLEREVHSVRKWFELGLELGLGFSTLEKIKLKHRENTSKCLHDMLYSWLAEKDNVKAKGGANWESLMNALKSSKVEEHKLAAQVSRNHRRKIHLANTPKLSTSPSLHTRLHPKSTPHSTLRDSVHRSPQQQQLKKSPLQAISKQTQRCTKDRRDRTTSYASDQIPKHPQLPQQQVPEISYLARLPVAAKWRQLGIQLGFPGHELDTIGANNEGPYRTNDRLSSMFECWLRRTPTKECTFKNLARALARVGERKLAAEVAGGLHS